MSFIEGGLRDRLLFESFHAMIKDALTEIGWFQSGRQHKPINFVTTAVDLDKEIPDNTLAVSTEDLDDEPAELGSTLTFDRVMAWVDFYAESDALGRHLQGDVRDILRGKMESIDRTDPSFMVVDMREPDPKPELFLVEIENVATVRDKRPGGQRHWYAVSCDLIEARP